MFEGSGLIELLDAQRDKALETWREQVGISLRGRLTQAELNVELGSLLDAVIRGVRSGDEPSAGEGFAEARALLADLSRDRARQGFSPGETALSVFALKDAVLELLGGSSDAEQLRGYVALTKMLDVLAMFTFERYAAARDLIITQQAEEMLELSTPVVKLWDGIVAVPLVGTLDSARTQVVTEKLLETLVETGSEHAIIDITGVPSVDTQVAQHLLKTVVAARLMGADCIVSGIRPQIAQTIVALGIEFGDIATKASLADALVLALRQSGVRVTANEVG